MITSGSRLAVPARGHGCRSRRSAHDRLRLGEVSSVRAVPETELMSGDQLTADDAWHTRAPLRPAAPAGRGVRPVPLRRRVQPRPGVRHAAGAGRGAADHRRGRAGHRAGCRVVRRGGGPHRGRALAGQQRRAGGPDVVAGGSDEGSERGEVVVALGLATAFLAATSAFAQLERGANRIYGTKRDRPALRKYGCAALLTATAGVALAVGLLLIVAGEPFGEALEQVYRWGDAAETWWDALRWPIGLAALVVAVTVLFQHAPRRKQPGLSWLAVGAAVTVLAWLAALRPARAVRGGRGRLRRDLRPAHRGDGAAAVGQRHRHRAARRASRWPLSWRRCGPAARTRCWPTPTTTASPTSSTSTRTRRPAERGGPVVDGAVLMRSAG